MRKILMGSVVSAAVLFGGMMAQPKPAQALTCGHCATEWTQLLNWALMGEQLVQDETQTGEMLRQGVELFDQGMSMKRMLERGQYDHVISRSTDVMEDLQGVQETTGGKTIYWDDAPGAVSTQETIFPDELPRDPLAVKAYRELQHQHVKETSLNAKAVTAQAMTDMKEMRRREAELEADAAACPGQTCVLDVQRQRSILAQEMAQRQAIVDATQANAARAAEDYNLAAKERADANWDIDMAGMPGVKSGQGSGLLSGQGRSTTGSTAQMPDLVGASMGGQ